jgi:signal peptidase I
MALCRLLFNKELLMLKKYIQNELLRNILEWAFSIAIAVVIFLLIDNFVLKSARVYGGSMEPTYTHHDRVIVNRLVYRFTDPRPGDVIAFPYAFDPSQQYIKRIVGMPGDVMDMRGGFVYRNDTRLDDAFSEEPAMHGNVNFPIIVEEGRFFVLGDNRMISEDSRFYRVGNVPREDILGRVDFRWFPFNRFGFVN